MVIRKEPVSDGNPKGAIDTNGYPKGASNIIDNPKGVNNKSDNNQDDPKGILRSILINNNQ